MPGRTHLIALLSFLALHVTNGRAGSFEHTQALLTKYCTACHGGKASAGGFNLTGLASPESLQAKQTEWNRLLTRVRNSEMPPKGSPAPALDDRQDMVAWLETTLRRNA